MSMRIDSYDLHQALHRAATEHLNTLGHRHGLPPVSWHVDVDDHRVVARLRRRLDLDDPRAAAEGWAAALGLREAPDLDDGSRSFTTDRPDSPVREVWYIADQPRWTRSQKPTRNGGTPLPSRSTPLPSGRRCRHDRGGTTLTHVPWTGGDQTTSTTACPGIRSPTRTGSPSPRHSRPRADTGRRPTARRGRTS